MYYIVIKDDCFQGIWKDHRANNEVFLIDMDTEASGDDGVTIYDPPMNFENMPKNYKEAITRLKDLT